ncbi:MAG: beta-galactosidase, partial [Bacteroidales bacterium]
MKFLRKSLVLFSFVTLITFSANAQENKQSFEIREGEFLLNGCPITIHSGEMHYPRIPKEYWRNRFRMMKALGLNAVATYVFWNYHNTAPGVWDFETGNRNLAEYIQTAGEEGLLVILRPGPYVCAEWEFGGYPWWLQQNNNLVVRANNQPFLDSCQQYYSRLADQVKDLQITKNGSIVLVQIENEFGSYVAQRKDIPLSEHRAYYQTIQKMLVDVGFGVPFFTSDATSLFQNGSLPQVLPTANGEGDISNLKKSIDTYY